MSLIIKSINSSNSLKRYQLILNKLSCWPFGIKLNHLLNRSSKCIFLSGLSRNRLPFPWLHYVLLFFWNPDTTWGVCEYVWAYGISFPLNDEHMSGSHISSLVVELQAHWQWGEPKAVLLGLKWNSPADTSNFSSSNGLRIKTKTGSSSSEMTGLRQPSHLGKLPTWLLTWLQFNCSHLRGFCWLCFVFSEAMNATDIGILF